MNGSCVIKNRFFHLEWKMAQHWTTRHKICMIMSIFFWCFSELCLRKAMAAYTEPQKKKKEESERLRARRRQDVAVVNGQRKFLFQKEMRDEKFFFSFFFIELCWGKAMVAYTKSQQWKKEKSERLRRERDQIKFIDLWFERWIKTFHKLHVLGMNDDLWDRVRGLGSKTWKGCEWFELLVVLTRLRGLQRLDTRDEEKLLFGLQNVTSGWLLLDRCAHGRKLDLLVWPCWNI